MTEKHIGLGLALLGLDIVTSAVVRYQLQFRQTIFNRLLVVIFIFSFSIGFGYGRTNFKFPAIAKPYR